MTKLGYTILYVENVVNSVEFYEAAFGFERKFITPENDYAELITGETTLSFASMELAHSNLKSGFQKSDVNNPVFGIELALVTENVQSLVDNAISLGAILLEAPVQKPWGQTVAYLRDINGFLLEICSPMGH